MSGRETLVVLSGQEDYGRILKLQRAWVAALALGFVQELVWIGSHPRVITLGRRGGSADLRLDRNDLAKRGIQVVAIERGGLATVHGPGQLVAYPILRLKDAGLGIRELVWRLEEAMIHLLADLGIVAARSQVNPGVWVGQAKIGFIGLAVRHQISFHGLALNLNSDPALFDLIVPCGLKDVKTTSASLILGRPVEMSQAGLALAGKLADLFGLKPLFISLAEAEARVNELGLKGAYSPER